jgi:hypothetical protein
MKCLLIASTIVIASALTAFSHYQLAPLSADAFVTLQQIVNEFTDHPDDALQKYNGMRICVYGRLGKVEPSDDDDTDPLTVSIRLPNQT